MTTVSRATAAGRAYLDLRAVATAESRLTDELIQLYVLEGFLARLVVSDHAGRLILKGGVLLAAFGTRRPTRDIDFAALDLDNDAEHVLEVTKEIAAQPLGEDDGLVFDGTGAVAEVIRDQEEYSGVRVSMGVALATAQTQFHVDVNVGDPIWPAPEQVEVPRLLGGLPLTLAGYSLPMVHAEKIVTAVRRGTVNTRWRDFGDVWTLSGRHPVNGGQLQTAIARVADHRNAQLSPLRALLLGYPALAQAKWAAWQRRQGREHLPPEFSDLLEQLFTFADPAISGNVFGLTWTPADRTWR
ncbi:nucleotidyl transferase AbiEii/AbiGii toxin family protein [Lapillicoccus sp.]|uniref:nucleotidyl transferase AbiEii/AbiGii toxin family protein n=1 Tax=Lapillicoccus sp. TaxID=1909287 RepID=UPI003262E646